MSVLILGNATTTFAIADTTSAGEQEAAQFTATENAIITELWFRTNGTANTGVTKLYLSLFGDANPTPASYLGGGVHEGAPGINEWVIVTGLSIPVTKGTKYWFAWLPIGGAIHYNVAVASGGTAMAASNAKTFAKPEGTAWHTSKEGPVGAQALGNVVVPTVNYPIIGTNQGSVAGAGAAAKLLAKNIKSDRVELWAGRWPSLSMSQGYGFKNITATVGNDESAPAGFATNLSEYNLALWTAKALQEVKEGAAKGVTLFEVMNEPYLKGKVQPAAYAAMFMSLANAVDAAGIKGIKLLFPMSGTYETEAKTQSCVSEGHGWIGDALTAKPALLTRVDGWVAHPYGNPGENIGEQFGPGAMIQQHQQIEALGFAHKSVYVTEFGVKLETTEAAQATTTKEVYDELVRIPWVKGIWYYNSHDDDETHKWGLFKGTSGEEERTVMSVVGSYGPGEAILLEEQEAREAKAAAEKTSREERAAAVPVVSVGRPHFDLPFRYANGQAAVNEQGSIDDIAACVFAVCATEPGQFFDLPEFGFPDLFGSQEPISAQKIQAIIEAQEPRASLLVQVDPVKYDESVVNANIQVS